MIKKKRVGEVEREEGETGRMNRKMERIEETTCC